MPPTDRHIVLKGITIHCIEDGRIGEEWEQYDNLSVLQQLGFAPERTIEKADTVSYSYWAGAYTPTSALLLLALIFTNVVEWGFCEVRIDGVLGKGTKTVSISLI